MKHNIFLVIIVYLFLTSCSNQNLISGKIIFDKDELGYSFVEDSIFYLGSSWAKNVDLLNSIDLGWSDFNLATPKYGLDGSIFNNRLIHIGKVNFENNFLFNENDWESYHGADSGLKPEDLVGQVFILKTHNNTFVKFVVRTIEIQSKKIEIEYIHQLDGSINFN